MNNIYLGIFYLLFCRNQKQRVCLFFWYLRRITSLVQVPFNNKIILFKYISKGYMQCTSYITYSILPIYSQKMRCILGLDSVHSFKHMSITITWTLLARGTKTVQDPNCSRKLEKASQGVCSGLRAMATAW